MPLSSLADLRVPSFHTTRWTRVSLAKINSEDGQRALADLCDTYYEPVVAYLRRVLHDPDEAREMSHAFFEEMLSGGTLRTAEQSRGRFRSYLLGSIKHFVSHQRQASQRIKRGGAVESVSLDNPEAAEVPDARQLSPDAEFGRQWAIIVIARGMEALRAECLAEGKGAFFEAAQGFLNGHASHGDQTTQATACGMSADAFRMAVTRLKKRLRQCVKEEIAGTLDDSTNVQDEMQMLFAALGQ